MADETCLCDQLAAQGEAAKDEKKAKAANKETGCVKLRSRGIRTTAKRINALRNTLHTDVFKSIITLAVSQHKISPLPNYS